MTLNLSPGVYVQAISTLPPSVAEVATAVPAFIGYTANGPVGKVEVAQIGSLLEYERRFGRAPAPKFKVLKDGTLDPESYSALPKKFLWYALRHYFQNGGGRCYVFSVNNASETLTSEAFTGGLTALALEDEPTLIVMPELVGLAQADFDNINQAALVQCAELGDRFALLDVKDGDVSKFRTGVSTEHLMYGAAYHPYLATSLSFAYDEATVTVVQADDSEVMLVTLKNTNTTLYNQVKRLLGDLRVTLPPSAAMAGIYARVDRERGVWKAPANVGVLSVIGPTLQISQAAQDTLNVDATTGKSINAIRAFPGRGTLVWGARTLAGNDNEWRYVPVRRLFITIEESARKASAFAVFEPNDATTWLKVKGMLEGYLYGLWEQGALQGAKPEAAYYVSVGLGKTMTSQDILEGRLIVEIGVAAVRPAEFIVLRFSHKLAQA